MEVCAGVYLALSDHEQKTYSELFSLCQVEGSPRLAAGSSKVGELFRASQLPAETLHQITELCGAKHIGYFGPAQFFIALKLIAAAQAGLPICLESIKCELPLASFLSMKSENSLKYGLSSQNVNSQISNPTVSEKGSFHCLFDGETQSDVKTPVTSPKKSSTSSSPQYGHGKIQSSSDHHSGAAYETRHPALLQQDGQLPLNYGNQPAPLQPSLSRQSFTAEKEAQDSSDSYSEDPWRITEEQREYYTNQFITLQPDLNSFISGSVAKNFFTKSKLPIPELSHVWDLSDVDCDGALTLSEFCAAFHLIVARKNGFDLPDTLPKNLLSEIIQSASLKPSTDGMYEAYRGTSTVCPVRKELETVREDPANAEPLIVFDLETSNTEQKATAEIPYSEHSLKEDLIGDLKASQEISTPPVATEPKKFSAFKTAVYQDSYTPKTRPRSRSYSSTSIEETMKKVEEPPTPPPRPQKTHSRASSLDLNRIIQQHSPAPRSGWIQPPPALPPRPGVSQIAYQNINTEQKIPAFADFKSQEHSDRAAEIELHPQTNKILPQTEESSPAKKEIVLSQPPTKPLRRKFHPESQVLENHDLSSASNVTSSAASLKSHPAVQKQPSKQKKAIQTAIRKNKEANAVLARLNSELQQQLKEVHQERIALETQLEQLRPLTVL
ncbi:ralBP1-associated Eps domain-containing protein 2 isoform X1 [Aquarana catesbeiana]|uniref:ralBP1-associated Eps domain-containing protein 2 isoform X1 n=1 Tax=Aquarana catesbeiana TaxID=8400 RepID=UPI003CC9D06B